MKGATAVVGIVLLSVMGCDMSSTSGSKPNTSKSMSPPQTLGSLEVRQPTHQFPVRRLDLAVRSQGLDLETGSMYWIDNDRLVVLARAGLGEPLPLGATKAEPAAKLETFLYVWDIRKADPELVMRLPGAGVSVRVDGTTLRVMYRRADEPYAEILEGPVVGERFESKVLAPFSRERDGQLAVNPFTGVVYPLSTRPGQPGPRRVVPLRPEHGFLDLGGVDDPTHWANPENDPVKWYPPDGSGAKVLPIWFRNPDRFELLYSTYTGEYVISDWTSRAETIGHVLPWIKGDPQRIHFWKPGEPTRSIELPDADYVPVRHALPTAKGLVIVSQFAKITRNLRGAGVYLFDGNGSRQLAAGSPNAYAVSPDGCKVAVGLRTEDPGAKPHHLYLIDLCAQGK